VSLGLAGLDAGLQPEVVTRVVKLPGVAKAAMSMTKAQSKVFTERLAQVKGEVTEAVVQTRAAGVRKADGLTTRVTVNADGTLSQAGPLNQAAQKMDAVAAKSASRQSAPKAFDANANAGSVKPFIGTKVDPNNLPEGYLYGKISIGKDKAGNEIYRDVIYMAESDGGKVPLTVDRKGNIKTGKQGEYRIVNDDAYGKNIQTIPGESGKLLGRDSQIHHLLPDNVIRRLEIFQESLRRGIYNPDRTSNLLEMANKGVSEEIIAALKAQHPNAQLTDIRHYSSHANYDDLVSRLIDESLNGRDVRQLSNVQIEAILKDAEVQLRSKFLGTPSRIRENLPIKDGRISEVRNDFEEESA
jgi:A nuclease family of the HNH/ENDO VII superfamily with conserved AHH